MTVTIGSLDNVPDPGAPIASPWAQEISGLVVHRFTSTTERDATWPSAPNGAVCHVAGVGWQRRHAGAWGTFLDGTTPGLLPVQNAGSSARVRGGQTVVTTAANGVFTIPHGLGVKPAWYSIQCGDRSSAGTAWVSASHDSATDATNLNGQAIVPRATGDWDPVASKTIRAIWVAGV